jgi:hypothetical protein
MRSTPAHRDVPRKIILKVADEVWIAAALLHREHADRRDFTVREIIARARSENITGTLRPGVSVHAHPHCIANRPPNSAQYRMLHATGEGARRLFRQSDDAGPKRNLMEGSGENHNLARKLLNRMFVRRDELITSAMTLGELLVKPLEANRPDLAQRYEALLGARP